MICENNSANAATLAHYIPILSGHIGKGFFICDTFTKCFYANHELLTNLHKIRLDTKEVENYNLLSYLLLDHIIRKYGYNYLLMKFLCKG